MEKRDHRDNPLSEKVIHEFHIEVETGLVDRVVAASEGDDSRPGDGEAVGFCASFFEERNVFAGAVVGVACYIS
jgi:hypothetical protein